MKSIEKILCSIILLFVLFGFMNSVYAATTYQSASGGGTDSKSVISAMDGLNNKSLTLSDDTSKLNGIMNTAIGFIQITGTGISVIMVSVLGIKYILASPGDKADVKKQITPMLIGAVVLFASANIVQIIADFAADL